jgi:hypothetical protein
MRSAAKPIAESRKGPAEELAIARVTTGLAPAPSVVADEMMTIAMTMPAMPVMAPASATRPLVVARPARPVLVRRPVVRSVPTTGEPPDEKENREGYARQRQEPLPRER